MIGIMAVSIGSARGATLSWLILDNAGEATFLNAELAGEKDSLHLTLDGEVGGLKIAVICTSFTPKGVKLEKEGKLTPGSKVVFEGCKVYKEEKDEKELVEQYECSVNTGTLPAGSVETGELKGELTLIGTKLLTRIEPIAGPTGNLVTIKFGGTNCVLPLMIVVHGTVYAEDCGNNATTHEVKHLIKAEPTSTALYIGGHSTHQLEVTKILGSAWIKLAGAPHVGLKWAAMDK
jgi:hypothetical protein